MSEQSSLIPEEPPKPQTPAELREQIEGNAADAAELSRAVAAVNLQFPEIGFIDPAEELEKIRRIAADMDETVRRNYPETIRAKILAHHRDNTQPDASDEELALAIFIRRTTDSPLTPEEVEAKTTGKAPKKVREPKAALTSMDKLKNLLGGV